MSYTRQLTISALPNQLISTVIGGQAFVIAVRQIGSGLFTSVSVDGEYVAQCTRATAGGCITPWPHSSVKTKIYWEDSEGTDAPQYEGLGSRWNLVFNGDSDG